MRRLEILSALTLLIALPIHSDANDETMPITRMVPALAAGAIRTYVAGESIERYNRWVAPPFTATGALNDRGGGELRNDNEEYGWMVPMRDRLLLRAPDLPLEFVGSDVWSDAGDAPYTGTYPSTAPGQTSAISGTSIPSWLDQRRAELESRTFCYDLAFASRGGNDLGNDNDAEYKAQLKELILLLANGSSCRTNPIVVVTGHMPDDQRFGGPDAEYVELERQRFVVRARDAVTELAGAQPGVRVRFVDQYTPFLLNTPTTAFPSEVWSIGGIPDYAKIAREGDGYHPRRLASLYAGELAANGLDLTELRGLLDTGCTPSATITAPASVAAGSTGNVASVPDAGAGAIYAWTISGGTIPGSASGRTIAFTAGASGNVVLTSTVTTAPSCSATGTKTIPITTGGTGPCATSGPDLCLQQNRFRLNVSWKNPYDGGSTGVGTAVGLTTDTGYFWFFQSANVELVVKVLDGRGVNGKFWVFYGALSDVEYTITITDTTTGAVKTYYNAPKTLASAADIQAF